MELKPLSAKSKKSILRLLEGFSKIESFKDYESFNESMRKPVIKLKEPHDKEFIMFHLGRLLKKNKKSLTKIIQKG